MLSLDTSVLAPLVAKLKRRSALGSDECEALLNLPRRIVIAKTRSYLVREGATVEDCILLLSGYAYRSKLTGDGVQQIVSIHMRGDLVDFQNSLLGEADHSVQTLGPTEMALIPHRAILGAARAFPAIGLALWRDTLVDASIFREWVLNVGRRDARQRIAHLLCELATRQMSAEIASGPRYQLPLTQELIGDATGLTTVHVNRTLGRLTQEGLISRDSRFLVINDWHALQAVGDFSPAYLHEPTQLSA